MWFGFENPCPGTYPAESRQMTAFPARLYDQTDGLRPSIECLGSAFEITSAGYRKASRMDKSASLKATSVAVGSELDVLATHPPMSLGWLHEAVHGLEHYHWRRSCYEHKLCGNTLGLHVHWLSLTNHVHLCRCTAMLCY